METSFASNARLSARVTPQGLQTRQLKSRKLGLPQIEPKLTHVSFRISDRFEDAREFYDFLEHKRTVKFLPHPTRSAENPFTPFDLVLNSKINYDAVAEKVSAQLGVPPTHIRFWTVNASTNNPKAPVRRGTNPTLRQILNPLGTNTLSTTQRGDAFYLEILEMSLAELDTKKSVKLIWLSEGITKEVSLLLRQSGAPLTCDHRTLTTCLCRKLAPLRMSSQLSSRRHRFRMKPREAGSGSTSRVLTDSTASLLETTRS